MKKYIPARIAALQDELRKNGLDAAMIYDRENLIYFAGTADLEGGALAVPAEGEPELFCLWLDLKHMQQTSGIEKVTPFYFPDDNQSSMMGKWLKKQGFSAPKLGFTRYFISLKDFQCLQDACPDMVVGDIAGICYKLRSVKCTEEISLMEEVSAMLSAGMTAAFDCIKPGILETEVLAEADYAMKKAGSEGASFRMQVLTHDRQMLVHPYAGDNPIQNNAPVLIHLGASKGGYVSKMCRTIFLGSPPKESVHIYETLREVQEAAIEVMRPGITCAWLYDFVAERISDKGYEKNWIVEHIGYGVGIRQSEFYPIIAKDSPVVLTENMIVDILLPTIYLPQFGGPRITDVVLIEKDGARSLTNYTKETIFK